MNASTREPEASTPADLDDAQLVQLIDRWRGALVGLARAWGASDPVELAQEVFAEAWLSRSRFRGRWDEPESVAPWLRGIAWNLASSRRRQRAKAWRVLDDSIPEPSTADPREGSSDGRSEEIRRAIDRLPPEQRAAVLVHYLERTPIREAAALLGTTEKTIEGRLYRARRNLARLLESQTPKSQDTLEASR